MSKSLDYYLSLDYPVVIRRLPADMGGGYMAIIRGLGEYAFGGDGDTVQEAYDHLQEVKAVLFADWLKDGKHIPEPKESVNVG